MIQEASRSSLNAKMGSGANARMIAGSATAVIISSRPARKTPAPKTPSSTSAAPRLIARVYRRPNDRGLASATRLPSQAEATRMTTSPTTTRFVPREDQYAWTFGGYDPVLRVRPGDILQLFT